MQLHNAYVDTTQVAGTVPATNVETVALVLAGAVSAPVATLIILEAAAAFTTGTATTAVTARIRRGATAAGALIGQAFVVQVGAALATSVSVQASDVPGDIAGQSYCLTLQQTAATGNGSALFASIQATWNA
jgi:hypothetical protein